MTDIPDIWLDALGPGRRTVVPFAARRGPAAGRAAPIAIPQVEVLYRGWDGPIGPWREHFGKGRGQVYPLDGGQPQPSCNEIEVAKLLHTIKPEAFWVSCYNARLIPDRWRPWALAYSELPGWLKQLDDRIRARVASKSGGIPDVVAWEPQHPLESAIFVECKGPREAIGVAQEDWASAAVAEGLAASQFAIAVRTFRLPWPE